MNENEPEHSLADTGGEYTQVGDHRIYRDSDERAKDFNGQLISEERWQTATDWIEPDFLDKDHATFSGLPLTQAELIAAQAVLQERVQGFRERITSGERSQRLWNAIMETDWPVRSKEEGADR